MIMRTIALTAREVITIDINEEKRSLAKQPDTSQMVNRKQISAQQIQKVFYPQQFQLLPKAAGVPLTVARR